MTFSAEGFDDRDGRLPPQVELVLYRVVQEALTNAAKHAGAHDVRVELLPAAATRWSPRSPTTARASTSRTMMRSRERGLGLFGMQERLALVGGQLVIDSAPGPRHAHPRARAVCSSATGLRMIATEPKIRVVLADDHAVLRAGLKALLNAEPDIEVVGEAPDGAAAVDAAREASPTSSSWTSRCRT